MDSKEKRMNEPTSFERLETAVIELKLAVFRAVLETIDGVRQWCGFPPIVWKNPSA